MGGEDGDSDGGEEKSAKDEDAISDLETQRTTLVPTQWITEDVRSEFYGDYRPPLEQMYNLLYPNTIKYIYNGKVSM